MFDHGRGLLKEDANPSLDDLALIVSASNELAIALQALQIRSDVVDFKVERILTALADAATSQPVHQRVGRDVEVEDALNTATLFGQVHVQRARLGPRPWEAV